MPLYDYECNECGEQFEKIVSSRDSEVFCPLCGASKRVERKFPNRGSFELKGGMWSYDGFQSKVPTHEVFNKDGSYKDKYQKKHDAGGTPIFDNMKGV